MCPPGLMMITTNQRANDAARTATLPRFYWDLARARDSFATYSPPYTPPVSIWYQLDVALAMMRAEGREAVFARHAALGEYTRQQARALGLQIFAEAAHASNTVTAITAPEGLAVKPFLKVLREEDHVILQNGQGKLEGKIFRIGHMGFVHQTDIDGALEAVNRRMK